MERARIVLLAAEGKTDLEIAASLHITNQKAARWRKRFLQLGLAGLAKDAPRPGRKPAVAAKLKEEFDPQDDPVQAGQRNALEHTYDGR